MRRRRVVDRPSVGELVARGQPEAHHPVAGSEPAVRRQELREAVERRVGDGDVPGANGAGQVPWRRWCCRPGPGPGPGRSGSGWSPALFSPGEWYQRVGFRYLGRDPRTPGTADRWLGVADQARAAGAADVGLLPQIGQWVRVAVGGRAGQGERRPGRDGLVAGRASTTGEVGRDRVVPPLVVGPPLRARRWTW